MVKNIEVTVIAKPWMVVEEFQNNLLSSRELEKQFRKIKLKDQAFNPQHSGAEIGKLLQASGQLNLCCFS